MIVTTTVSVEGRRITEYKGIVFGEVISGVNSCAMLRLLSATFSAEDQEAMRKSLFRRDRTPEGDGTACGRFGGQCGCRR